MSNQESIIKSILRSFLKGVFSILGILITILIALSIIGAFAKQDIRDISYDILPDLDGNKKPLPHTSPAILQIEIDGMIGARNLTQNEITTILLESRKNLLKENRVKAILIKLKTPGGDANDSDAIYRAIMDYKKRYNTPVFAYVDGLCASGGCYISAAADKIYASPTSIIGSIGVRLGPFFNVKEALEKIGVTSRTLTDGKNKDILNPFRTWRDDEDEQMKKIGNHVYLRFVNIFSAARPRLTKKALIEVHGANIYDSQDAEKFGYIDNGDASYRKTLEDLLKKANIKKPYQVVRIHPKKKWLSEIMYDNSLLRGKIEHSIKIDGMENNKSYFSYIY